MPGPAGLTIEVGHYTGSSAEAGGGGSRKVSSKANVSLLFDVPEVDGRMLGETLGPFDGHRKAVGPGGATIPPAASDVVPAHDQQAPG